MTDQVNASTMAAAAGMRWYVVHAYSGMEKAVERNITERVNNAGMQDKFGRILVPTEEVVEVKNGQKRTTERKFFPGYVLVEMMMDDDTWHLVKHTNKVTGFVGGPRTGQPPFLKKTCRKSSRRCSKVLTSRATKWSLWWANTCVSKRGRSQTSMALWKRSTMRRASCVCQ